MKYLQAKKKNTKIRVGPSREISIPMYNILKLRKTSNLTGEISVLSLTGAEMIYQGGHGTIKTKIKYLTDILARERDFKIMDDFKFIEV